MTSQDPVTSKSHTFQDYHGDVRSRPRQSAACADRFLFLGIFRTVPRPFPVALFLSFFLLRLRGFSFLFLSHFFFLFVLVHGHFCSVVVGFSISQPPFPSCQYVIPSEKYTSMTSVDCRVISSLHVQFNEMKVRLGHSYVRIQASDGCKSAFEVAPLLEGSKPTAHRSRDVGGREARIHAHARMKTTRSSAPSLPIWKVTSSYSALPCELTRQNRHVYAGLPRRRTTTRSRTVRLNSKLSKATLTSRTEEIRRQNIRLNSCSFTLKERPDSDNMVRQKSSKKQRKSLAGDAGMLTFCKVRDRGHVRAQACYGTPWQQHGRLRTCAHHVERRRKSSLERRRPSLFWKKITPGMSDSFETLQE